MSARTKTECREKLRKAMSDADQGIVCDAGALTLGDYLDKWVPTIKDTVRQRTWERYERLVRVHIKPALGKCKLKNLNRNHVKSFYADRRGCVSARTT